MERDIAILGIALGLGLLVGLQRERIQSRIAGIRTFSLITLLGAISGLIARETEQIWIVAAGALSIAILMATANFISSETDEKDIGQTTEIAALMMYVLGAYLVLGTLILGVVVGSVVALLLYLKAFFKEYVARLGEKDVQAIMVFVAVTLVVLPILPDEFFGPYDVLNLRQIWLMVVLIVGMSIAGYFAYKWLGAGVGTGLSGILGGLISSTATTVTYARLSKTSPAMYLASFVIVAATAVSFVRVMIEVAVVAPAFTSIVLPPIIVVTAITFLLSGYFFWKSRTEESESVPDPQNPAQFRTALVFAILYAVILILIAFVKDKFGSAGLYVVSLISGLTDVDAVTLSLANLINSGSIVPDNGWRFILVAAMANLVFKGGMVAVIGNRQVFKFVGMAFAATLISGVLVLFFWP